MIRRPPREEPRRGSPGVGPVDIQRAPLARFTTRGPERRRRGGGAGPGPGAACPRRSRRRTWCTAREDVCSGGGGAPGVGHRRRREELPPGHEDSAYALVQLLSVHAPGALYPNRAAPPPSAPRRFTSWDTCTTGTRGCCFTRSSGPCSVDAPRRIDPSGTPRLTAGLLRTCTSAWRGPAGEGFGWVCRRGGGEMDDDDGVFDAAPAAGSTPGRVWVIEDLIGERPTSRGTTPPSRASPSPRAPSAKDPRKRLDGAPARGDERRCRRIRRRGESPSAARGGAVGGRGRRHVREWMSPPPGTTVDRALAREPHATHGGAHLGDSEAA